MSSAPLRSDARPAARRVACVVVAAGSGARLAADRPKAFVLLDGRTLLEHAVQRVRDSGAVDQVVAVVPAELVPTARRLLATDVTVLDVTVPQVTGPAVTVVEGGADRSASVSRGLAVLGDDVTAVLVHDAARCLAPPSLFEAVVAALGRHDAVVPGLAVVDTVKQVDGAGRVVATPDRSALRAVQTPQGFDRGLLERAHRAAAGAAGPVTDDAGLVERLGEPVHVVPGDALALKITTAQDLAYAHWVLTRPAP